MAQKYKQISMQQSNVNQAPKETSSPKKGRNKYYKWNTNVTDYIWCPSCKVYLQDSNAMQEHEKSMNHTLNKGFQQPGKRDNPAYSKQKDHQKDQESRYRTESKMGGPKTVHLEYNIANLWREICEAEGTKGANFLYAATNVFVCRPCQVSKHVTEILEHVHGLEHQETISMEINIEVTRKMIHEEEQLWERVHPAFRTHETYIRIQDERHFFCFLCEKNVPAMNTHNLLGHVGGKNHMKNVNFYLQSLQSFLRGLCLNPDIQSLQQLSNSEYKEMRICERLKESTDDAYLKELHSLINKINSEDEKKQFCHTRCACLLCDLEFDSGALWLNHMNERFHKQNVENLNKSGKKMGKFVCCMCNAIMFGQEHDHRCVDADGLFVPRVFVSDYGKEAKLESLYDVLQTYGTIINCALTAQEAIFEFQEREAIRNILKNRVNFQGHILTIQPLKYLQTPTQVSQCMEDIFSSVENFNGKVKSISEIIGTTSNQSSDNRLARFLERKLSKAFNTRVRAYIFGSRVSGIAFPDSDVDIFADTGRMYGGNNGQEVSIQNHIVNITAETLKAHPDCEEVIPVPKARTPIVKFKYLPTNSYCDIAFRHGLGCENTKLIRFYLSLDPSIKPLIGFLKFWMQVHELSGPKKFTSYAIVWLVIFFLQQLPDVNFPTVEDLHKGGGLNIIAGWKCSFNSDRSALAVGRIPHSMLQLVYEFFKFYNEFDFATFVVCPLTGRPEPKTVFKYSPTNLPESMKEYVRRLRINHYQKLCLSVCCVQDPFELNHNVSKAASSDTVKRFQNLCGLSVQLCTKLESEGPKFES